MRGFILAEWLNHLLNKGDKLNNQSKAFYTWEEAKQILFASKQLYYPALKISDETPDTVWVKIKNEKVGLTAYFGYEGKDKIVSQRWYPGGLSDFKLFLLNAGIITV